MAVTTKVVSGSRKAHSLYFTLFLICPSPKSVFISVYVIIVVILLIQFKLR